MQIELVGIVTLILGIATLWFGPGFGVAALATTSLLGAAAAVKLPVLGGSSITPGHLLLPFYIWVVGRACGGQLNLLRSFSFPSPAFWLAAFTVFAAISAVFLPRLFAGSVEVFGVARGPESQDRVIMLTLLRPTSGNITQSVYLVANAVLLAAAIAHVRYANGARAVVRAVYAVIGLNIAFGIADYVTYSQGMSEVMAPIRNANYAQLNEVELYGLKRTVGSFTEGSVYGAASLVCLAFSLELWMRGVRPGFFGMTSLLSLFGLVSSFSSAALGAFGVYMILLWLRALVQLLIGRAGPSSTRGRARAAAANAYHCIRACSHARRGGDVGEACRPSLL